MSYRNFFTRLLCASALLVAACSGASPVEPAAGSAATPAARSPGSALPGSYTLTFRSRGIEVTSLPVRNEIGVWARVTDYLGQPAVGSVTFEYCSRTGPPNDITRVNEAPKAECEAGTARWKSIISNVGLNRNGEAGVAFCCPSIPRKIGFRFRYQGGNTSGVANGIGGPLDFEWTAE